MPGVGVDHTVPGADHDTRVMGCRGLFLPDRHGSRAAMDPGLTLVKHSFDTPSVEHKFERLLRRGTIMEHEGEPHAQVGGDARRHGQHHGVDPGPRRRRTRVPVLRRAGAAFKPLDQGWLATLKRLWWCRPCETTWVA